MASFGSTPGLIVAAGVGAAASVALEPAFELPKQQAWEANPNRILDPGLLARLVAQGGVEVQAATDEAQRDGYGEDKLAALIYLAQTTPAVAEAMTLWRRGLISDELWQHALVKAGLDTRYVAGLSALKESEPLDPAVIATAIQRGIIEDPGFLPVKPPSVGGKVLPFPVAQIDALAEAAQSGVSRERLFAETAIVGLPASPDLAARMTFRQIIERADFDRAVSEGNTRNEWRDALFEGFREILTAREYAELELRGFLTADERRAATAKHGMSGADSDLLYDVLGRAIATHAVTTGLARGGKYPSTYDDVPEPYRSAIERSNIRPEWAGLAYANRYSYPSAFVIRALLTDGVLSAEQGKQVFLDLGWRPDLAEQVATAYAGSAGGPTDPHVKKAQTQLWTTTHRSYVAAETDEADARARLAELGVAADAQTAVLALWTAERALIRKQLSPSQIRKAVQGQIVNLATGQPWTGVEAEQALLDRGYSRDDALTFLSE